MSLDSASTTASVENVQLSQAPEAPSTRKRRLEDWPHEHCPPSSYLDSSQGSCVPSSLPLTQEHIDDINSQIADINKKLTSMGYPLSWYGHPVIPVTQYHYISPIPRVDQRQNPEVFSGYYPSNGMPFPIFVEIHDSLKSLHVRIHNAISKFMEENPGPFPNDSSKDPRWSKELTPHFKFKVPGQWKFLPKGCSMEEDGTCTIKKYCNLEDINVTSQRALMAFLENCKPMTTDHLQDMGRLVAEKQRLLERKAKLQLDECARLEMARVSSLSTHCMYLAVVSCPLLYHTYLFQHFTD